MSISYHARTFHVDHFAVKVAADGDVLLYLV